MVKDLPLPLPPPLFLERGRGGGVYIRYPLTTNSFCRAPIKNDILLFPNATVLASIGDIIADKRIIQRRKLNYLKKTNNILEVSMRVDVFLIHDVKSIFIKQVRRSKETAIDGCWLRSKGKTNN